MANHYVFPLDLHTISNAQKESNKYSWQDFSSGQSWPSKGQRHGTPFFQWEILGPENFAKATHPLATQNSLTYWCHSTCQHHWHPYQIPRNKESIKALVGICDTCKKHKITGTKTISKDPSHSSATGKRTIAYPPRIWGLAACCFGIFWWCSAKCFSIVVVLGFVFVVGFVFVSPDAIDYVIFVIVFLGVLVGNHKFSKMIFTLSIS